MSAYEAEGRCWGVEWPAPGAPNRLRAEVYAIEGPGPDPVWMTADEMEAFAAALLEAARRARSRSGV